MVSQRVAVRQPCRRVSLRRGRLRSRRGVPPVVATGKPVRVKNSKLAQSISDAAWGELLRQLDYKCKWYGRTLVKIDRWFPSSKRCGYCGYIVESLPLNIREWDCPKCGAHHDRDINAARNILAAGHAVSVCGANVRPDVRFVR